MHGFSMVFWRVLDMSFVIVCELSRLRRHWKVEGKLQYSFLIKTFSALFFLEMSQCLHASWIHTRSCLHHSGKVKVRAANVWRIAYHKHKKRPMQNYRLAWETCERSESQCIVFFPQNHITVSTYHGLQTKSHLIGQFTFCYSNVGNLANA